jgi:hypothetical protein
VGGKGVDVRTLGGEPEAAAALLLGADAQIPDGRGCWGLPWRDRGSGNVQLGEAVFSGSTGPGSSLFGFGQG